VTVSGPLRQVVAYALLLLGCGRVPEKQGPAPGIGLVTEQAMVVSAHPLATEVGVSVMREGGNAIDAAVAVHYMLAVVLPWAGNIGGGGFMLARMADGTVHSLDFRETAPAAAHRDMYLDSLGNVVPGLSLRGHRAVGVPGAVAGLFAMHDSLGTMPMARLIAPAIVHARKGFALTQREAEYLDRHWRSIEETSTLPTPFATDHERLPGDTLRLPELAAALERVRDNGKDGFYSGLTADLIVAEMARGHGLLTHDDLAAYRPRWRKPVQGKFRDMEVIGMGPPSSGGIALIQLLAAMEATDGLAQDEDRANKVHRMVEAMRRVYADRAVHLGDADFVDVPIDGLIDRGYMKQRMADFDPQRATPSAAIHAGEPWPESDRTTHFSIVDPQGNAVAITTTLNGLYGSHVVVGGAGFLLNNEMDDFSAKPGVPNLFGVTGGTANAIAPGKRMLSSMSPTIVTRDGALFLVLGSPGGSTIITSVFQTILRVVEDGMDMQAAVAAGSFPSPVAAGYDRV
jgi:gamma-glutamyltranspeptidase / glutathione hydrolase